MILVVRRWLPRVELTVKVLTIYSECYCTVAHCRSRWHHTPLDHPDRSDRKKWMLNCNTKLPWNLPLKHRATSFCSNITSRQCCQILLRTLLRAFCVIVNKNFHIPSHVGSPGKQFCSNITSRQCCLNFIENFITRFLRHCQ